MYSWSVKWKGIKRKVSMEQVTEGFTSDSKTLGPEAFCETNEVEKQLQTSGYCNSPSERS